MPVLRTYTTVRVLVSIVAMVAFASGCGRMFDREYRATCEALCVGHGCAANSAQSACGCADGTVYAHGGSGNGRWYRLNGRTQDPVGCKMGRRP